MRRLGALICAAMMMVTASPALAVDIINEDGRPYQMEIKSSTMEKSMKLNANTHSIIICVGTCRFNLPGVGKFKASGNDRVEIRNGRVMRVKRAYAAR